MASAAFVVIAAPARGVGNVGESCAGRRLGITVSRKVGGAVVRNAVKRRVREWFRTGRGALPAGSDWVVIARRGAAGAGGAEIRRELDRLSGALVRRVTKTTRAAKAMGEGVGQ